MMLNDTFNFPPLTTENVDRSSIFEDDLNCSSIFEDDLNCLFTPIPSTITFKDDGTDVFENDVFVNDVFDNDVFETDVVDDNGTNVFVVDAIREDSPEFPSIPTRSSEPDPSPKEINAKHNKYSVAAMRRTMDSLGRQPKIYIFMRNYTGPKKCQNRHCSNINSPVQKTIRVPGATNPYCSAPMTNVFLSCTSCHGVCANAKQQQKSAATPFPGPDGTFVLRHSNGPHVGTLYIIRGRQTKKFKEGPPAPRLSKRQKSNIILYNKSTVNLPFLDVGQGTFVRATTEEGAVVRCQTDKINHQWKEGANVRIVDDNSVVALRPLQKGEELFADYGVVYWVQRFLPSEVERFQTGTFHYIQTLTYLIVRLLPNRIEDLCPNQRQVYNLYHTNK